MDLLLTNVPKKNKDDMKTSSGMVLFAWSEPGKITISELHEIILYRLSGYVVTRIINRGSIKCRNCILSLEHKRVSSHKYAQWLLKTYFDGKNLQFQVSDAVFQLFRKIEWNLQNWKKRTFRNGSGNFNYFKSNCK